MNNKKVKSLISQILSADLVTVDSNVATVTIDYCDAGGSTIPVQCGWELNGLVYECLFTEQSLSDAIIIGNNTIQLLDQDGDITYIKLYVNKPASIVMNW